MEEIKGSALKIARPRTAVVGGVLSIIAGVLTIIFWVIGITILNKEGYFFASDIVGDFIYELLSHVLVLLGGIFILRRKYRFGGALALVFSIITTIGVWYLGICGIVGGILGLISEEKIEERVLGVAKLYGRMKISDLATKLAIAEADVELGVINLQSKGEPIKFNTETREVVYG